MKIEETQLPGVFVITPNVFSDARGFFLETWRKDLFASAGIDVEFVQDNCSYSADRNTLRGLHYQVQQTQGKLVRVTAGEVFDVAVDIRRSSPEFGRWIGVRLSSENKKQLWVPPGFAHGFLVTSKGAEFSYKCTDFYAAEHERGIRWDDCDIGIDWPLEIGVSPILSAKDSLASTLQSAEVFP